MFPILNPPPSSLPIPSLWGVHQPQASSIIPSWSRILPLLAWLILLPLEVPSVWTGVQTVCQLLFIVTTCLMFSIFLEHQSLLQNISIACQRLLPIKGVSSLGGLNQGCSFIVSLSLLTLLFSNSHPACSLTSSCPPLSLALLVFSFSLTFSLFLIARRFL